MAYKVFTNGSPLPASDLNTYLMNQSVMVFADSTARSAALTAPTEGMVTYLEDTGLVYVYNGSSWVDINDNTAAIPKSLVTTAGDLIVADGNASVTRLGIGTTGQVLSSNGTTAVWDDPVAGGMVAIASGNFSTGASVLDLTSISQGYNDLRLVMKGVSTGVSERLRFKINNDSSALYGVGFNVAGTNTTGQITDQDIYASSSDSLIVTSIYEYANTSTGKLISTTFYAQYTATTYNGRTVEAFYRSTDAVTEINIFGAATTNNFTGGSYILYGVN